MHYGSKLRLPLFLSLLFMFAVTAAAQSSACPALVQTALAAADQLCAPAGRNQACFGNVDLSATPQPTAADFNFNEVGDIEDVTDIQSLRLAGMNETANTWGIVIMRLQGNIANSLPGQNVTFLLFGDVEITNAGGENTTPMQAFILRTGFADSLCEEAPQSGLLVQTPKGVGQVMFNVNGVDVSMGSTVFFQAQRGRTMKVRTVEGVAAVTARGRTIPVIAGTQSEIPMNDDLQPDGEPSLPEAYEADDVSALPVSLLDDEIEIAEPLDEDWIDAIQEDIEDGWAICGDDPLPSCDELPYEAGGDACIMAADESQMVDPSLPYCDEEDYEAFAEELIEDNEANGFEEPPADDSAGEAPEFDSEEQVPAEDVSEPAQEPEPPAEDQSDSGDESGGDE